MNAFCIKEKPEKKLTFRSIENIEKFPFPVRDGIQQQWLIN